MAQKCLLFANTEWYLYNFRLALAKAIREAGFEVVFVSPYGPFGARLQAEGFRWFPVYMDRRSLNPWSETKLILDLVSLYKRERPDLVHHFTLKSVVYGSIAARLAGIQNRVNAVTGLGHVFTSKSIRASLVRPVLRLLLRSVLGGASCRLIVQNEDDYAFFREEGLIAPDRIRLIRSSGVNTSKFGDNSRKLNFDSTFKVLLATRLLWDKGVGEYVEAARILKHENRHIQFLMAGAPDEGNPASVPNGVINEWVRDGIVDMLGHVDDMPALLRSVDLVVLPSYREGVPRILVEAASCGLPIVATDVPGCREIVVHNVNGLLVPAKDSTKLTEAIKYLADNTDECARLGLAGRKKVLAEFDEELVIRETFGVYRELISLTNTAS